MSDMSIKYLTASVGKLLTLFFWSQQVTRVACTLLHLLDSTGSYFLVTTSDVSRIHLAASVGQHLILLLWSQQVASEECGTALAQGMAKEPYFVDFLRDADEPTGKAQPRLKCLPTTIATENIN